MYCIKKIGFLEQASPSWSSFQVNLIAFYSNPLFCRYGKKINAIPVLTLLAWSCGQSITNTSPVSRHYNVYIQGHSAGQYEVEWIDATNYKFSYFYNDRGRGPNQLGTFPESRRLHQRFIHIRSELSQGQHARIFSWARMGVLEGHPKKKIR